MYVFYDRIGKYKFKLKKQERKKSVEVEAKPCGQIVISSQSHVQFPYKKIIFIPHVRV